MTGLKSIWRTQRYFLIKVKRGCVVDWTDYLLVLFTQRSRGDGKEILKTFTIVFDKKGRAF